MCRRAEGEKETGLLAGWDAGLRSGFLFSFRPPAHAAPCKILRNQFPALEISLHMIKNRTNVCKSVEIEKRMCYDKTNKCSDLE